MISKSIEKPTKEPTKAILTDLEKILPHNRLNIMEQETPCLAVVIPCFRVKRHILSVLNAIGPEVDLIIAVDDACPEETGLYIGSQSKDPRVKVLFHESNKGVGGATKTGMIEAARLGASVIVKLDGDGQMDPIHIPRLSRPIFKGWADYCKGNRFDNPRLLKQMPLKRLVGNAGLSFLTKASTGYWNIMDPTNGFFAIHAKIVSMLEIERISDRYFFETDLLFRLHLIRAVVRDVPLAATYGDEKSNLSEGKSLLEFSWQHCKRIFKRIIYDYFVHDFNVGTMELIFGLLFFCFGIIFGATHWILGVQRGLPNETGTIMISVLPTILGFQLLLAFIHFDMNHQNKDPLQKYH